MNCPIIAMTNQNLNRPISAHALSLQDLNVLLVDLDPQGNATKGLGVDLNQVQFSISDLLRSREFETLKAISKGSEFDLITAVYLHLFTFSHGFNPETAQMGLTELERFTHASRFQFLLLPISIYLLASKN